MGGVESFFFFFLSKSVLLFHECSFVLFILPSLSLFIDPLSLFINSFPLLFFLRCENPNQGFFGGWPTFSLGGKGPALSLKWDRTDVSERRATSLLLGTVVRHWAG